MTPQPAPLTRDERQALQNLIDLNEPKLGRLPWAKAGTKVHATLESLAAAGLCVLAGSSATGDYYQITADGLRAMRNNVEAKL